MKLTTINSFEDIKEFVRILIEDEDLAFHPDTPFEEYINLNTNQPTYSKEEATLRNNLLQEAFALSDTLDVDTHELMCEEGFDLISKDFGK